MTSAPTWMTTCQCFFSGFHSTFASFARIMEPPSSNSVPRSGTRRKGGGRCGLPQNRGGARDSVKAEAPGMRFLAISLLAAGLCAAQTTPAPQLPVPPASAALIRGVLLERDPQTGEGEFAVRIADNRVFRYRFDRKPYEEREQKLID